MHGNAQLFEHILSIFEGDLIVACDGSSIFVQSSKQILEVERYIFRLFGTLYIYSRLFDHNFVSYEVAGDRSEERRVGKELRFSAASSNGSSN